MGSPLNKYTYSTISSIGKAKKAARQRGFFKYIIPNLPELATVLEIGSGRGEFAIECRNRGLSYVGVEPSDELRKNLGDAGFDILKNQVPPIPLESETIDLIHSHDFVEHLSNYIEVMDFFSESYRVLKPGGYTTVVVPNYQTLKELFFQYEYQHTFITTKYRILSMLRDCGFQIIKAQNYLIWLTPKVNWIDRILANILIPFTKFSLFQGLVNLCVSEDFLFRIHKNMHDHTACLAKKPIK